MAVLCPQIIPHTPPTTVGRLWACMNLLPSGSAQARGKAGAGTSRVECRSRWCPGEAEGQTPSQTAWSPPWERDKSRGWSVAGSLCLLQQPCLPWTDGSGRWKEPDREEAIEVWSLSGGHRLNLSLSLVFIHGVKGACDHLLETQALGAPVPALRSPSANQNGPAEPLRGLAQALKRPGHHGCLNLCSSNGLPDHSSLSLRPQQWNTGPGNRAVL